MPCIRLILGPALNESFNQMNLLGKVEKDKQKFELIINFILPFCFYYNTSYWILYHSDNFEI
jgi:hypothetical protein